MAGPVTGRALAAGVATAVVLVAAASRIAGGLSVESGALLGLAALLAIGLVPLLARGLGYGPSGWVQPLLAAAGVAVAFFAVERLVTHRPTPLLPMAPATDLPSLTLLAVAVALSAIAVLLPLVGRRGATTAVWARLYLRARNGWYANVRFDSLTGAYRIPRALPLATELPE
jgi:hypothetical protein